MSSRLMSIPVELRLMIYELAFADTEPDESELYGTHGSTPIKEEDSTSGKKKFRQIDLLTAKKHYPEAELLITCREIYKEAEPVVADAVKIFWDIDVFNVFLDFDRLSKTFDTCVDVDRVSWTQREIQCSELRKRLNSMSLLRSHRIKSLGFTWSRSKTSAIVAEGEDGPCVTWHQFKSPALFTYPDFTKRILEMQTKELSGDIKESINAPTWLVAFLDALLESFERKRTTWI